MARIGLRAVISLGRGSNLWWSPDKAKRPMAGALDSNGGEAGIPFPLRGNNGSALKRSARNAKNSPLGCFLYAFPPHRFESMKDAWRWGAIMVASGKEMAGA